MRMLPLLVCFAMAGSLVHGAVDPEIATLNFDTRFYQATGVKDAKLPAWITKVEQQAGRFTDDPRCWQVDANAPEGSGRIEITIDREKMASNLIATVLFDAEDDADLAVQLFDRFGRVIVVDLFGNLVDVGKKATTDTFIIPWKKYPTAEKIVLRRVSGAMKVYGLVLYPVITEGTPVKGALEELAKVLGDPLSPENPLLQNLKEVAKGANVGMHSPTSQKPAAPAVRGVFPGAVAPPKGASAEVPAKGLVGHWSFDAGDAADGSGRGNSGRVQGGATFTNGPHGKAVRLRKNPSSSQRIVQWDAVIVPHSESLDLKDNMTLSAWIKYNSIAPTWGSQILWYGDSEYGRDPWTLQLYPDGSLLFRSDRSVTGRPKFTVFEEDLYLSPKGKPQMNQHVGVKSPSTLEAGKWYFVAATMEKTSPRVRTMRLFVNGAAAGEEQTEETVNYETPNMWMTIGGVDKGTWQNFDGEIDEVRIYDRALTPAEIQALYNQPWK